MMVWLIEVHDPFIWPYDVITVVLAQVPDLIKISSCIKIPCRSSAAIGQNVLVSIFRLR